VANLFVLALLYLVTVHRPRRAVTAAASGDLRIAAPQLASNVKELIFGKCAAQAAGQNGP
jgi:hypothetical protein